MSALRVALGEYDIGWQDPDASLERARGVIERAASAGAGLVVLPEMCLTGFTMDPAAQAEPLDGVHPRALAALAAANGVEVLASIARREEGEGAPRYRNSAIHVAADGRMQVVYDKQRLFAFGGERESYTAGTGAPCLVTIGGVRIATFVCYDLRFPELFREVAASAHAIVVVANWPTARRAHWDVLLRARAIENQCWVVGVNRTGTGGRLEYDGGSAAYDPWGDRAEESGDPRVATLDAARVAEVRERYPFLADRA